MVLIAVLLPLCLTRAKKNQVKVNSTRIANCELEPDHFVGLQFTGGLVLRCDEDDNFGGWSGLATSSKGQHAVSVSDRGHWLEMTLEYSTEANHGAIPVSVSGAKVGPMRGLEGEKLDGKSWSDAESVVYDNRGDLLVSFERHHRVWRYQTPLFMDSKASTDSQLETMSRLLSEHCTYNGGAEGIEVLLDGSLVAFCEDAERGTLETFAGWVVPPSPADGKAIKAVRLDLTDGFRPTDLSLLPGGAGLMVLQRMHGKGRTGMRLGLIPEGMLTNGNNNGTDQARIKPAPVAEAWQSQDSPIDNMEGLSSDDIGGVVRLSLISDDNFSASQRTVYLTFEANLTELTRFGVEKAKWVPAEGGASERTKAVVAGVAGGLAVALVLAGVAMVFVAVRHHRRAREARYHHICELTRVDFE